MESDLGELKGSCEYLSKFPPNKIPLFTRPNGLAVPKKPASSIPVLTVLMFNCGVDKPLIGRPRAGCFPNEKNHDSCVGESLTLTDWIACGVWDSGYSLI